MRVSKLGIDQKNSLYYEFEESKQNTYTYVFVNALTGNTSAWNGVIGKRVRDADHGYFTYNFRGQIFKFWQKHELNFWNNNFWSLKVNRSLEIKKYYKPLTDLPNSTWVYDRVINFPLHETVELWE